jgi:hypothetical protein
MDERSRLAGNTNEDEIEEEVEAHRLAANRNESVIDTRKRLAANTNEDEVEDE